MNVNVGKRSKLRKIEKNRFFFQGGTVDVVQAISCETLLKTIFFTENQRPNNNCPGANFRFFKFKSV